jgi:hypothetical protein
MSLDDLAERKPDRGGPFIEIEISRAGADTFEHAEFETLKAGDRFRVLAPESRVDGLIWTCETDAIPPGPGDVPGNWAVRTNKAEAADRVVDLAAEELERTQRVEAGLDHPLAPWPTTVDVIPPGFEVIEFKVDPAIKIVELCGIRYQMSLFRALAESPIGAVFRVVGRSDGTVALTALFGSELPAVHALSAKIRRAVDDDPAADVDNLLEELLTLLGHPSTLDHLGRRRP